MTASAGTAQADGNESGGTGGADPVDRTEASRERGPGTRDPGARDRLVEAAAKLISESGGEPVSTRAVLAEAGVKAPTLYHHFGDKQGLFAAVVEHGFTLLITEARALPSAGEPLEEVRRLWDTHTAFGRANPAFYRLMYGSPRPGSRPSGADEALALLLGPLSEAARSGMLRMPGKEAAHTVMAANVGATLALIAAPEDDLSARIRDAVIGGIAREREAAPSPGGPSGLATLAIALDASLDREALDVFTPAERVLLQEWLHRLSG